MNNKKVIDVVKKVAVCAVAVGVLAGTNPIWSKVDTQEATVLVEQENGWKFTSSNVAQFPGINGGEFVGLVEVKDTPAFVGNAENAGVEQLGRGRYLTVETSALASGVKGDHHFTLDGGWRENN